MATITKPVALDETLKRIAVAEEAKAANANLIYLPIVGSLTDTIELAPEKAIYRATPTISTTTVTIPTPDISAIPVAAAYFCFELEIEVDDDATTLVGPISGVAFDSAAEYALGDYVIYGGKLYECTTAHTGAWEDADFTAVPDVALSWTFLEGGDLPDAADAAGKTLYISCRLDCTARTVVANVWRVG